MNILFLNRGFFEYDKYIKRELERRGHKVYSYCFMVSLKKIFSIEEIIEIVKRRKINRNDIAYALSLVSQRNLLKKLRYDKKKFDVIFVLAGQDLSTNTLKELKEMYPNSKFVWYIWDDIKFLKNYKDIKQCFDAIISFNADDAKTENIEYLPTFYINKKNGDKVYDLCFIGSDHRNRISIIADAVEKYKRYNNFIYIKTSITSFIKYLFISDWWKVIKYTHFKSIPYKKMLDVMAQSKATIEIPLVGQKGFTLRTYEAMGVSSKLITSNSKIKFADFYNPKNIKVFDNDEIELEDDWLNGKYENIPENILRKYSLETWIDELTQKYFIV